MIVTITNSSLPIAANVVIGTNIFSDIGASYVDFFGGRSTSFDVYDYCGGYIDTSKSLNKKYI